MGVESALWGLAGILGIAFLTWLVSLVKRDVSIVDSVWALLFWVAAVVYALTPDLPGPRAGWVLIMVSLWALRLSGYITWRNWGEGEDFRYREIRANNEPLFELKSLYIVFGLQGLIAWIVSWTLVAAITSRADMIFLDYVGILLWAFGMAFETVSDFQLARFKADPANRGKVLDTGLWRYTRHPNYFGEACIWWGFFIMAVAAGGWWSIVSPILMTVMLLKVSGVSLLERDIDERRPGYREYVERTNAFIPGPRGTV
ncbi:MAG: DUF1295 domain-containing protein [Candidatus Krumholzibacteria bacterium]|nr:DUF1295 domain-containing protein [Candidatus Krumholzibacteria bacterium]